MCVRFARAFSWDDLIDIYRVQRLPVALTPRYNVAPSTIIDVIIQRHGLREVVPMRWGFIPSWWQRSISDLPLHFRESAETIKSKPTFRDAYKKFHCLVPISGYYEWTETPSGKQPYFLSSAKTTVLSVAGLWSEWKDPATGRTLRSCTTIHTPANVVTSEIHRRMPSLVALESHTAWLEGSIGAEALRPAPPSLLRMWRVSRRVNKAFESNDATLITPVSQR
jgi:putative SOS response-associated peptidase YedK